MSTLFVDREFAVKDFIKTHKIDISLAFLSCMDEQLTKICEVKTGLKANKNLSITWMSEWHFFFETGVISKIGFYLYVNHNWNPVTVLWKSKSGRIYKLEDTDIDCEDVEFWFEDLDVALIHRQMYPNVKLPFKLKDLSYELVVTRINMDCTLQMQLKPDAVTESVKIIDKIDNFIAAFNQKSEKGGRKNGVIHHWTPTASGDTITYEIDLGSTGPYFFKKLLPALSEMGCFTRVELC